jgi:hypothetical protein
MKKPPTTEDTTHDAGDAPAEPFMRECEALVQTPGSPDLDLVRQHLVAIESALRRRNGENVVRDPYGDDLLQRVVQLEKQRRGLNTEYKRIRYAFDIVAQLIKWGDVSKSAARYLHGRLASIDPRYGDLEIGAVQERLLHAADAIASPGNQGRGKVGAKATLAAFMAEVGAHDIDSGDPDATKNAVKKIKDATRTAKKK